MWFFQYSTLVEGWKQQRQILISKHDAVPWVCNTCSCFLRYKSCGWQGRGSSRKERTGKVLLPLLCPSLGDPMGCSPPASSVPGILQSETLAWIAISFSQGIFPTQGSNPGLPHCGQILDPLSHQGTFQRSLSKTDLGRWSTEAIASVLWGGWIGGCSSAGKSDHAIWIQ